MLWRLFQLPSIVYFVLAPIVLALGVFGFFYENSQDAERTEALAQSAPEPVTLEDLTSSETGNPYNEITLVAQVDTDMMIEWVEEKASSNKVLNVFAPLHPTDAVDFSAPVTAVAEFEGNLSNETLGEFYIGDGPAGPVFAFNGVLEGGGNFTATRAMGEFVTLAEGVQTVRPFVNGRAEDLKAADRGLPLLIAGLIIAALLGGYGYFRKLQEQRRREEELAFAQDQGVYE